MKQITDYADILIPAPCYLWYLWAANQFCKKYLGAVRKNELLFLFCSFCSWLFLDIVNRWYAVPYIFVMMLNHIFFMGLILLLFQADSKKKMLSASLLMTAMTLVGNFCGALLSCMVLFFRHTVKKIPEPLLGEWEMGLIEGVSFCFVVLAVYWMSKQLGSVFYGKSGKWYIILAVPLLMLIAVIDLAGWGASIGIIVRSEGNMGLYYDQMFSHTEFGVLTLLSMVATGFYVFGMDRIYLEQEKSSQYHSQIAVYKMLEEEYRQSERLRHDMKNHIIALSGLFRSKEWEKMGEYLRNMEDSSFAAGGDTTGNKVVDALLYQKRKQAERESVKWECDMQMPKGCCINEFDLCVLLGNILDNALEACERLRSDECRFVHIQARTVKKCFLLEVKNSMDIREKYRDGFTKKENSKEHGIGLLNVGDVVHKYNGVVHIEAENGIFMISILIPLNDAAHDMKQAV